MPLIVSFAESDDSAVVCDNVILGLAATTLATCGMAAYEFSALFDHVPCTATMKSTAPFMTLPAVSFVSRTEFHIGLRCVKLTISDVIVERCFVAT